MSARSVTVHYFKTQTELKININVSTYITHYLDDFSFYHNQPNIDINTTYCPIWPQYAKEDKNPTCNIKDSLSAQNKAGINISIMDFMLLKTRLIHILHITEIVILQEFKRYTK